MRMALWHHGRVLRTEPRSQDFSSLAAAAAAAATALGGELRHRLSVSGKATVMLDGFDLPTLFLDRLSAEPDIDWTQVIVFQAGEYLGASSDSSDSIQKLLNDHLIVRVPIITFHYLRGDAPNPNAAAANFSARLAAAPCDLALIGFGLLRGAIADSTESRSVALCQINDRKILAVTRSALTTLPRLIALGEGALPETAISHPNSTIFRSILR